MKDMGEIRLYASTNIAGVGSGLILTTLRLNKTYGNNFEIYIFVSDHKPIFIDEMMSLDLSKEFDDITGYDIELMRGYVYDNAYDRFVSYLHEIFGDNLSLILQQNKFCLTEIDKPEDVNAELTKLWVFGKYRDQITAISRASKCYELKQVLQEISKLPSIKSTSIKGKA